MSLASLLSIARSALIVHQRAMEVTGHNVANANTPGYSKQTLQLQASDPLVLPQYTIGRGVDATSITRERDTFYDAAYRRDSGLLGQSSTTLDYLGRVESALNEPSTDGVSAGLDKLFSSLYEVANDPSSHVSRELAVSAGKRLTQQVNSLAGQLDSIGQESLDNFKVQVGQVNLLSSQIAALNGKVIRSTGSGGASSDLMDQRDLLVDKLSTFMDVRVLQRADGTIAVAAGDAMLVDGTQTEGLALAAVGSGWGVMPAGGGAPIDPNSGSLKGLADLTQVKLPAIRAKLDQFAAAMVTEFNQIHRTGTTPGGATNIDFFDPTGTTASSFKLSAALLASSDNLATSANGAPGNGDIATQLAGLATRGVASLGGSTFREHFVGLASGVGLDVTNADQDTTAQQTLVDGDDSSRTATSGVNVDEEMINLIASQQAYSAAAHLVTVADQMVQAILAIT